MLAKKIIMKNYFDGMPKLTDFEIVQTSLPPLKTGDIQTEALYISVDPYIRAYSVHVPTGSTVVAGQIARVTDSMNPMYKKGDLVFGYFGWQTHCVVNPAQVSSSGMTSAMYVVPDLGHLSPSLALGVLGMTGASAYFGFLELCDPKPGEVVVVTGAAGAVGSHVAQIAKHIGCVVIGIAGTAEKVKWLKEELKLDAAFNYKTDDIFSCLAKAVPQGIDCYFDNVGGELSSTIMYQMNEFGRVSVCGSISAYNCDAKHLPKAALLQPVIVLKQLKVQGFIVSRWQERFPEAIAKNQEWIKQGWLKYPQKLTEGFEKLPEAFVDMLQGGNIGKAVVKV